MSPSADIPTIFSKMQEHDIETTLLYATYFPHKGSGISNYRLKEWIHEAMPMQAGKCGREDGEKKLLLVGSLDFEHYFRQGHNELEEIITTAPRTIAGIKFYTCYQNIDLSSEKVHQVLKLAEKYSLPVIFHAGDSYGSPQGEHAIANLVTPRQLRPLVEQYSSLNFIVAHLAEPFVDEVIELTKAYANVYSDCSGLLDSKVAGEQLRRESVEDVKRFLGECGPEKLLFGTDFPVQSHDDSIYFAEEGMKRYSEKDREDVYYNNARRIFPCLR